MALAWEEGKRSIRSNRSACVVLALLVHLSLPPTDRLTKRESDESAGGVQYRLTENKRSVKYVLQYNV